jgi:hypothetical protein
MYAFCLNIRAAPMERSSPPIALYGGDVASDGSESEPLHEPIFDLQSFKSHGILVLLT